MGLTSSARDTHGTPRLGGGELSAARTSPTAARGFVHRAVGALLLALAGTATAADITAPALNWVLPVFTKEGYRSMTARGTEARVTGDHQFEVIDLNLTLFSADATMRVENIILSPAATFLSQQRIARGDKFVRFIGDDVEATGKNWIYLQKEKKISLDGAVRVTFEAELKNLLK